MQTFIDFDDAVVFAVPLAVPVRGATVHEGMLIEGPQGWGEFAPPPGADAALAARHLTAAVEAGTVGWPDPRRGRVPVAVTVADLDPDAARAAVAASGCRAADVLVGDRPLADDAARVAAVRAALGPDGAVRCDAGGRWDAATAAAAIAELDRAAGGLEFVARPCPGAGELAALRRRVGVPLAAEPGLDADIVLIDGAAAGGVRRALRLAERSGRPCVVAAGVRTGVGLAAALALAGAVDSPYAAAVGGHGLLAGDLVAAARSHGPVDGGLPVAPTPPAPDPERLRRHRVTDSQRIAAWRELLARARATAGG